MNDYIRRFKHNSDPGRRQAIPAGHRNDPTPNCSLLFPGGTNAAIALRDPSHAAFFHDLNLDQVIASIIRGRGKYDLAPLFYTRLQDSDAITYRHEVLRDLEGQSLRRTIDAFAKGMKRVRRYLSLSARRSYPYEKHVWSLLAAQAYTEAVAELADGIRSSDLPSRGFTAFRTFLIDYVHADAFQDLASRTQRVLDQLADVRYCLHIEGTSITITGCNDEQSDFSAEVARTFARFREDEVDRDADDAGQSPGLDDVEIAVLERIARLYPRVFADLQQTSARQAGFLDDTVNAFDREIQFYLAYLDYIMPMQRAGLPFSYPHVSRQSKQVRAEQTFDIALAHGLAGGGAAIVRNDFALSDPERVLIVTGANQGGKTTFARMFGQLHYLAALGLPVPGHDVHLFQFDQLLTHFPKKERLEDLRGRLEDELVRVHKVLERATPNSIVILNELFGATKLQDAKVLGAAVLEQIERLDLLCVFVTFLDELASPVPNRVSLVAKVDPDDPSVRTYKVVRQRAEGRAHAFAIAEKYGLTYEGLRDRITK